MPPHAGASPAVSSQEDFREDAVGVAERKPEAMIDSLHLCLLRYNACIHQCFERRTKGAGNMVNGLANNAEMDESSNCDATVVLLKKGK